MKKSLFFAVALTALTLASCSNDENVSIPVEKGPLQISLPGADTRAVEGQQAAGLITPKYDNAYVYLVDAGGNAEGFTFTPADLKNKYIRFEEKTTPARVIVVANSDVALSTGMITETALRGELKTLTAASQNKAEATLAAEDANGNAAGTYQSVHQVTLYGESATFTAGTPWDDHHVMEATVTLSSLVARFEIGTLKPGNGLISLTVKNVYINGFYESNDADGAKQSYTENTWPTPAPTGWFHDGFSAAVTSMPNGSAYAYQVFALDVIPHIIFEVDGVVADGYALSDGTNGAFTGKYVTVTGYKEAGVALTQLIAHHIYKVGLEDGGIEITPDKITDKPETEKFDLQINITVAPWTSSVLTPEV